jgi:hypothetical protein
MLAGPHAYPSAAGTPVYYKVRLEKSNGAGKPEKRRFGP